MLLAPPTKGRNVNSGPSGRNVEMKRQFLPSTLLLLLVVLACPLTMVFMMGGHGHGSDGSSGDTHQHRDSAGRS